MMEDVSYSTIIQCRERSVSLSLALFECSLPRRYSHPLPRCPSCVLAWQYNRSALRRFCGRYLWDSSVWERNSAWLPIYLSLISIMHTPAIPPTVPQSLSLCCHTQQNITLSFSSALLHFVFSNKGTFLSLSPRWWLTGLFFFVLIPLKSFGKWIPTVQRAGHSCIWRLNFRVKQAGSSS